MDFYTALFIALIFIALALLVYDMRHPSYQRIEISIRNRDPQSAETEGRWNLRLKNRNVRRNKESRDG